MQRKRFVSTSIRRNGAVSAPFPDVTKKAWLFVFLWQFFYYICMIQLLHCYSSYYVVSAAGKPDTGNLFERHAVANLLAPLHSWEPLFEHAFMSSVLVALTIPIASQKAVSKHATVPVQQSLNDT